MLNSKKIIFSWALYDWANSVFATTVLSVFFPLFFNEFWSYGCDTNLTTARLGIANAFSGFVIVIIAPFIGAIADKAASRKKFLTGFIFLGTITTCLLFFIPEGSWVQAAIFYVLATMGFSGGNIFYDSLITNVCTKDKMNFVSSLGFSLGYLGGGFLLILQAVMHNNWKLFGSFLGLDTRHEVISSFFLMAGIWWFLFSLPLIFFVTEKRKSGLERSERTLIRQSLEQLLVTFQKIKQEKTILYFLIAYWIYIDGVDTIIRMAIDYGVSINLKKTALIGSLIITQFVGFPSSMFMAYLAHKFSAKKTIIFTIFIYFCVSIFGVFIENETHFYILAATIGLVQGGIQALSRSYFAKLIPTDNSAEYFGIYNMIGKFAVIFGPIVVGFTGLVAKYAGYSESIATRAGIGSISIFFIIGGILFFFGQRGVETT